MDAATQTPCSLDIEIKELDNENTKNHVPQLAMEYSYSRRLSSFLDTPQSISSTSQSWLSNHPFQSQETFSLGEYHQQHDQPIYFNDDYHELAFASSPDQVLIAPLHIDDTKQLPHAQSERQNLEADGLGDPVKTDQAGLPLAMLEFFSNQDDAIQPSPVLDKVYLDQLLLNDLPMIMDMSVSKCGGGDLYLFPYGGHPLLSSSQPSTTSLAQHPSSHPSMPTKSTKAVFSPPSVITDHTDRERSFACDSCHQKYTRPQDCIRHIKSAHIKTKHFICHQAGCEGSYCRSDVLKRHLRIVHHLSNK